MKLSIITIKNVDFYGLRYIDTADWGEDIFKVVLHEDYILPEKGSGLAWVSTMAQARECVRYYREDGKVKNKNPCLPVWGGNYNDLTAGK